MMFLKVIKLNLDRFFDLLHPSDPGDVQSRQYVSDRTARDKADWLSLFVSVFVLVATVGSCSMPSLPDIPDTDLVFQRYPVVGYDESTVLGFINSDGTSFEERELIEESGGLPTWSSDGKYVFYRWDPPSTISSSTGQAYVAVAGGRTCRGSGLWGSGRLRAVPGQGNVVLTSVSGDNPYMHQIGIVDPVTCEIVKVIYHFGYSERVHLRDPALSMDGLLALQLLDIYDGTEAESTVVVINLETGKETKIGYGVGPSWSPDGQWLAYTARDGIYLARPDGSENNRVVDYDSYGLPVPAPSHGTVWRFWPPYPEWSPDGQWLVYHLWENKQYNIHKLNLETGEDEVIFEGGLYPHWRWTSESKLGE